MRSLGVAGAAVTLALLATLPGCGSGERLAPAPQVPELRIGMSIGEAKRELGDRFLLPSWGRYSDLECSYFEIEGSVIGGLVTEKRIATVGFAPSLAPRSGEVAGPGPEAPRGLRPTDKLARALELFGRPDRITPAPYGGGEEIYWKLAELDGEDVLLRVSMNSYPRPGRERIGGLSVGVEPEVSYMEGCA